MVFSSGYEAGAGPQTVIRNKRTDYSVEWENSLDLLKRALKYILATIFILVIGVVVLWEPNSILIDGAEGLILERMLETDTKYSINYTDAKFLKVKVGMTESEVLKLIGEPLVRWRPYRGNIYFPEKQHFVGLQYSESPRDTHFHLRQVYLDSGIVAEAIHYFYVD